MQPEIVGAIIGGVATVAAAIIGGWVAIRIKHLELKAKGLIIDSQSSNNRLWGTIGALILGGIVFISLTAFGYFPSIFQPIAFTNIAPGKILLSDDFDNTAYERGYNSDIWSCNNCEVGSVSHENGTIRLEVNGANLGLNLSSKSEWSSSQIKYITGKLKLTKDEKNGNGTVDLSLHTTLTSKLWQVGCLISSSQFSLTQAEFGCEIFTVNPQQEWYYEYRTPTTIVNYGEWQEVKIEIDPKTFELSFYLDGKLIGQHTPADANEIRNMKLTAQIGIYTYNNKDGHPVANINDVLVVPAK